MALPAQPAEDAQAKSVCPHCGNPVRPEARFCPVCGKVLAPAPAKPETPAPQPQAVTPPAPAPAAAQPVKPEEKQAAQAKKAPKAKGGKKSPVLWIVGILVLLLLAIAAIIVIVDPFGWRGEGEGTTVQEETITPTGESTSLTPTSTALPVTPSPTIPVATATPTIESGVVIPPGLETATPSPGQPAPGALLLDDNFTGSLEDNWEIWGSPDLVTSNGRMELKSPAPGETGASSIVTFPLSAGVIIQVQAGLMGEGDADQLWFDWQPANVQPGAGTPAGPIRITILPGEITAQTNQASANQPITDNRAHLYEIRIQDDLSVSFMIDGRELAKLPIGAVEGAGSISFTGQGWVDDVKVYGP